MRVVLTEEEEKGPPPFEKDALTWADVEHDLEMAKKLRFSK